MRVLVLLSLAGAALIFSGCTRWGIGKPPALVYQNTTTPMWLVRSPDGPPQRVGAPPTESLDGAARPSFMDPLTLPENAVVGRSRAFKLGAQIPGIPASSRILSVGWGNASLEKAIEDGELERLTFADAQEIEILGIFHKVVMHAYGPPRPEPAP